MNDIYAGLCLAELRDEEQVTDVLRLMCQHPQLVPEKFGDHEPLANRFDASAVGEMARAVMRSGMGVYWQSLHKYAGGCIAAREGRGTKTASVNIWTSAKNLGRPEEIIVFLRDTFTRFDGVYGFLHYIGKAEVNKACGSDALVRTGPDSYAMSITRWKLVRCIPDLYWGNVFGPEYVALFGGRECVASAPAPVVQELAPNTFYLQLSANIDDCASRYTEMEAVREQVKRHLGADCFFDPQAGFNRTYRVPKLGWEEPARAPITLEKLRGTR